MDDLLGQQLTPEQAATLREMERKSNDRILVYNPTEKDYLCRWDSRGFVIPSKTKDSGYGPGYAVHPRYVAKKYVKEMVELIRGTQRVQAIVAENQKRIDRGQTAMNHHEDRLNYEANFRDDDPQFLAKLIPILWRGIHEEYGMDDVFDQESERKDPRSMQDQILANLDKPAQKLNEDISIDDITGGNQPKSTTPVDDATASLLKPPVQTAPVAPKNEIGDIDAILSNNPLTNVNPEA